MRLYLDDAGTGPVLYVRESDPVDLVLMKADGDLYLSIDPVEWARAFDHTNKEYPRSDADLADEKHDQLYLNTHKANPHRDPSIGTFINGGQGRAKSGEGRYDLSGLIDDMMERKE